MTTRTRTHDGPTPLSSIAVDLRAALSSDTGPSWVQRRWAPDIDLVLQRNRETNRWRLAATTTSRHAPAAETLSLLAVAFGAPDDDWTLRTVNRRTPLGEHKAQIAEVTWTERT